MRPGRVEVAARRQARDVDQARRATADGTNPLSERRAPALGTARPAARTGHAPAWHRAEERSNRPVGRSWSVCTPGRGCQATVPRDSSRAGSVPQRGRQEKPCCCRTRRPRMASKKTTDEMERPRLGRLTGNPGSSGRCGDGPGEQPWWAVCSSYTGRASSGWQVLKSDRGSLRITPFSESLEWRSVCIGAS